VVSRDWLAKIGSLAHNNGMANRDNHYEAAFEGWLRAQQVPYVAVDEARRALMGGGSLKSLDYIVSPELTEQSPLADESPPAAGRNGWLVDVKGRKFPSGNQQAQYWKNWSTQDDLWSLGRWEQLFGGQFCALFVFAYLVVGDRSPLPEELMYEHGGRMYGFVGVTLRDYARWARPISPPAGVTPALLLIFCALKGATR